MTVLMLSFEFPPLIVGGLGMVCHGLAGALTKIGIGVNLVLPVETPCYFALRRPEDRDALSPVFLDGEPSLTDAIGLSGDALFLGLI